MRAAQRAVEWTFWSEKQTLSSSSQTFWKYAGLAIGVQILICAAARSLLSPPLVAKCDAEQMRIEFLIGIVRITGFIPVVQTQPCVLTKGPLIQNIKRPSLVASGHTQVFNFNLPGQQPPRFLNAPAQSSGDTSINVTSRAVASEIA